MWDQCAVTKNIPSGLATYFPLLLLAFEIPLQHLRIWATMRWVSIFPGTTQLHQCWKLALTHLPVGVCNMLASTNHQSIARLWVWFSFLGNYFSSNTDNTPVYMYFPSWQEYLFISESAKYIQTANWVLIECKPSVVWDVDLVSIKMLMECWLRFQQGHWLTPDWGCHEHT